jgi:hypothetical protein
LNTGRRMVQQIRLLVADDYVRGAERPVQWNL